MRLFVCGGRVGAFASIQPLGRADFCFRIETRFALSTDLNCCASLRSTWKETVSWMPRRSLSGLCRLLFANSWRSKSGSLSCVGSRSFWCGCSFGNCLCARSRRSRYFESRSFRAFRRWSPWLPLYAVSVCRVRLLRQGLFSQQGFCLDEIFCVRLRRPTNRFRLLRLLRRYVAVGVWRLFGGVFGRRALRCFDLRTPARRTRGLYSPIGRSLLTSSAFPLEVYNAAQDFVFFLCSLFCLLQSFYKKRIDEKRKKVFPVNPKQGFVFTFSVSVLIYASPFV